MGKSIKTHKKLCICAQFFVHLLIIPPNFYRVESITGLDLRTVFCRLAELIRLLLAVLLSPYGEAGQGQNRIRDRDNLHLIHQ